MIDYQEVLNTIKQKADEYYASGKNTEWVEALTDYDKLQEWIDQGNQGECPVDVTKYGFGNSSTEVIDERFRTDTPEEITDIPISASSVNLQYEVEPEQPKDTVQIQRLISQGLQALGRNDFENAISLLEQAIDLDPENPDAIQAHEKATKLKREKARKDLIYTLRYVEDVGDLKKALEAAEAIVRNDPDDEEIAILMKDCQERFNQIRDAQGAITTAEAISEYEPVKKAIHDITVAMNKGQKTWNDQRLNKIRPIEEVLSDFQERLGPLALVVLDRELAHVHDFLPDTGHREPNAALERLKYAITLDGLDQEKRNTLDRQYRMVEEECEKWKKANSELEKANRIDLNSYERFLFFLNAKTIYPHHSDVLDQEHQFVRMGAGYLAEVISKEIRQIRINLEGEAQEALNQRLLGENPGDLEVFKQSRKTIQDLLAKTKRFDEILEMPENIKEGIAALETLLVDIEVVERRRKGIRNEFLRVSSELQKDPALAIQALNNLSADFLGDPEITYLRENLTKHLSAEDNLSYAQKMFDSKKFGEAQDALRKISDPGPLREKLERLKEHTALRILQKEVVQNWSKKYYRDAYGYILKITQTQFTDTNFQQNIIEETNIQEKLLEYQEREELDSAEQLAEKEEGITRAWGELENQIITLDNCVDWLDQSTQVLRNTRKIASLQSTLEGKYLELETKIKNEIHDKVFSLLDSILIEDKQNIDLVFQMIQRMQENNLVQYQKDRGFRKKVLLNYFNKKQAELEPENRWREIINIWDTAVSEYPDDTSVFNSFHLIRFKAIMHAIEDALSRFDFSTALEIATQEELPYGINTEKQMTLSVEQERELAKYQRQAEAMKQANDNFEVGEYVRMHDLLEALCVDHPPQSLLDYKQKLENDAITLLNQKGNDSINTDLTEGVLCYATVLRIDKENMLARAALNRYRSEVVDEINRLVRGEDELSREEDIDLQLERNTFRGRQIDSLLAAADLLLNRNSREKTALIQAKSRNTDVRMRLERAKKILEKFTDNSPFWKSIITRDNRWNDAAIEAENFREETFGHIEYETLINKINATKRERENRQKIRQSLENSFLDDDFDSFLSEYPSLLNELYQDSLKSNETTRQDKYSVFPNGLKFYDVYTRSQVPFFHENGEETPCAVCMITARRNNKLPFLKYKESVENKLKIIGETLRDTDFSQDTYHSLEQCGSFVDYCESALRDVETPTIAPISKYAETLLIKGGEGVKEIQKHIDDSKTRLGELQVMHRENLKKLDSIIDSIADQDIGNYQSQLEELWCFYRDDQNEFQEIITSLLELRNRSKVYNPNILEWMSSRMGW